MLSGSLLASQLTLAADPARAGAGTIEEIVVTAEKREGTLQDTPVAITAFDLDSINDQRLERIEDLQIHTPGLVFGSTNGITHTTMRGVGQSLTIGAGETGVALYVDGVYMGHNAMSGSAFRDLERIEVLRGPQGTLYGRNATGGAINLVSREPGEQFASDVEIMGGSDDAVEGYIGVEGGLGARARGRLAFLAQSHDGWRENLVTGEDMEGLERYEARATLVTEFTDTLKVTWRGDWNDERVKDGPANFFIFENPEVTSFSVSPSAPGGVFQPLLNIPPAQVPTDDEHAYHDWPAWLRRESGGGSATVDWQADDSWGVRSIIAWHQSDLKRRQDIDGTDEVFAHEFMSEKDEQFTVEINLSGATDWGLDWIAGVYYLDEEIEFDYDYDLSALALAVQTFTELDLGVPLGTLDGVISPFYNNFAPMDIESKAVFGQVTYAATDRLNLTAGARYTQDDKKIDQTVLFFGAPLCENLMIKDDWNNTTWKIGADYAFSDDVMGYVSVSTGFKAGGMNFSTCTATTGDTYDPEEITSYEVGLKSTLLDDRLRLNAAAYFYDYTDLQVSVVSEQTTIENAADSEVLGAEVELLWVPTDRLEIGLNLSVIDDEFKDFQTFDPLDSELGAQDLSGNKLPRTADYSGNLSLAYLHPLRNGELEFRYELYYTDGYYHQVFNTPATEQKSYDIQNLRVFWRANPSASGQRWEVGAFVENLSDEVYKLMVSSISPAGGFTTLWSNPRTWGVYIRHQFN